jgi:hypothetical protein
MQKLLDFTVPKYHEIMLTLQGTVHDLILSRVRELVEFRNYR